MDGNKKDKLEENIERILDRIESDNPEIIRELRRYGVS